MWSFLRPEPHRPLLPKEQIDPTYKRLRVQVFIGIFIGYAGYYLVRKNFALAMPYLVEMGFDKGLLGVAISANAIAYGLSKFLMGGVSDRSSARKFLPLGLTLSALTEASGMIKRQRWQIISSMADVKSLTLSFAVEIIWL